MYFRNGTVPKWEEMPWWVLGVLVRASEPGWDPETPFVVPTGAAASAAEWRNPYFSRSIWR